jgi:GTP-binding protein HflX
VAHLLPGTSERLPHQQLPPLTPGALDIDCAAMIQALENELERVVTGRAAGASQERALLVSVFASPHGTEESMAELKELAGSGGIKVIGTVIQHRDQVDHRFLIGSGKLQELAIHALQEGATIIIFDQASVPASRMAFHWPNGSNGSAAPGPS